VVSIEGLQWGELDFPADLVTCRAIAADWLVETAAPLAIGATV
jgi:choline kinase